MRVNITKLLLLIVMLTGYVYAQAHTYLVSVGIADYSGFPSKINNLSLPSCDAKTIANFFSQYTSVDYALLTDEKATKDRILRAMSKVFNLAKKDDLVVFFFSGHGYTGGICAYDGRLSYKDIRKAMSKSECPNKMMFVDACHSGSLRVNKKEAAKAIESAKKANVLLFLSSRDNESSLEARNMKNGYFTTFLEKGLKGNADTNQDKIVTARELFDFVHNGVVNLSFGKQHPVMWGSFSNSMPIVRL